MNYLLYRKIWYIFSKSLWFWGIHMSAQFLLSWSIKVFTGPSIMYTVLLAVTFRGQWVFYVDLIYVDLIYNLTDNCIIYVQFLCQF